MVNVTARHSAVVRLLCEPFQYLRSMQDRIWLCLDLAFKVWTVAERINPMDAKQPTTSADKMKSVKAVWDKAPAGPKKDAALKHYQAAEKAQTAKNDTEANRELDAATHALA